MSFLLLFCQGNGRPFVLRVENAKVASDPPTLDFIRQNLEQGLGLNKELDVEVLALKMVSVNNSGVLLISRFS